MWIMNITLNLLLILVILATTEKVGANQEQDLKPQKNEDNPGKNSPGTKGGRKGGTGSCRRKDKATLNNNLINMFHSEYVRYYNRDAPSDSAVVAWKFRRLDADGDKRLERREYRDLRRVARKAARPKRCSRSFPKRCDQDGDAAISKEEWTACLSVRRPSGNGGNGGGGGGGGVATPTVTGSGGIEEDSAGGSSEEGSEGEEEDYGEEELPPSTTYHQTMVGRPPPHGVLSSERTTSMDGRRDASTSDDVDADDQTDEPTDCLSDRRAAMSEGVASVASQLYVPECTPDGRYQKVQCYRSAGYCWCVDEATGRPRPGTSVKGAQPRCDPSPGSAAHSPRRAAPPAWKGCPREERKWAEFIRELVGFLLEGDGGNTQFSPALLRRAFGRHDADGDGVWGRAERKRFREAVNGRQGALRRCGRRLPRYCDANADGRLTAEEWIVCLTEEETRGWKGAMISGTGGAASSSPRAGKINPLSMLKDD